MLNKIACNFYNMELDKNAFENYLNIMRDCNHRFKSWEHCYHAFGDNYDEDYLSLNLAFYLASWGMYRGGCGLFWKDYKIHTEAVKVINDYRYLRYNEWLEFDNITNIMDVFNKLKNIYENISYFNPKKKSEEKISATDTLITKILLGTLGCVPAFDRCFKAGYSLYANKSFDEKLLREMIEFINANKKLIKEFQIKIYELTKYHYPPMKIVDMCFWQKGFEKLK